jgi:hypothetical protein
MTRPFGIWCQRGRNLKEWYVTLRGAHLLACIWNFELLHCTFMFILVMNELWLVCNNLWDFVACDVVEN